MKMMKAMKEQIRKKLYFASAVLMGLLVIPTAYAQQKEQEKRDEQSKSYFYKAEEANAEENFAKAEANYRIALDRNKKNAAASYNMSHLYAKSDKFTESMKHLLETAKNADTKALRHKAFHNLGNAFMKQKDYGQAIKAYKDALRNDPTDDQTRYNLALAKRKLEKERKKSDKNKDQKSDKQENKNKKNENKKKKNDKQKNENKKKQQQEKQNQQKQQQQKQDQKQKQGDQQKQGAKKKQPQKPQPQKGKISKQQAKNLLRAARNLEKETQKKMRAKKAKKAPDNPKEKYW